MPRETNPGDRPGRSQNIDGSGAPADGRPQEVVVVQFKGHRKGYFNNQAMIPLTCGQYCVVEADRGRDMGRVTYTGPGKPEWWTIARKQGVLAVATSQDLERLHNNRGDEWEFWDICQEKIQKRRLRMNLVSVERQFDHKKITFYFTAEKRVDFRELVRDLAAVFRTRIELRQIGVRDEARLKGGLGICGREFCCSTFLHDFIPVTLKMAKVQQLPLNPGKLSGPCGRLRCCMAYEQEVYLDSRRRLPRVGTQVSSPDGVGTVRKLDLLRAGVSLDLPGVDGLAHYSVSEITWEQGQDLPSARQPDQRNCGHGSCPKQDGDSH